MTTMYGTPADHAAGLARRALLTLAGWALTAVICGALLLIVYPVTSNGLRVPALAAGWVGLIASVVRARAARIAFMRAYTGVIAEQTVAKALRRCGVDAVVNGALLHHGDADHVVFGPVFAVIETKHGRGHVSARQDGFHVGRKRLPRDPVTQVITQADTIRSATGRTPSPVVCVAGMVGKPFQARGVWVTSARDLAKVLKSLPNVLDAREAVQLAQNLHTTSEANKMHRAKEASTQRNGNKTTRNR